MTLRTTTLLAGMIALSAAVTCPAMADVYYVTYTGTASGTDTNGVFGAAGAALNSVAFTSTYTYDPSRFGNATQIYTSTSAYAYGGTEYSVADPLLSATLTINGHAYSEGSSYFGEAFVATSYLETEADSSDSNNLVNDGLVTGSALASLTSVQSFSIASGQGYGHFNHDGETLSFTDTYVSVTDGPPGAGATMVPEPSSLGLLGGAATMFGLAVGGWRAVAQRKVVSRLVSPCG